MDKRVLVLNSWYFPYQILGWQDAVRLIYVGSASVVAAYDEQICSPSVTWNTPAVIRLASVHTPRRNRGVKFSRFNVFARDGFCCQYCGAKMKMGELTYDHVVPKARGGRTAWENIVSACRPCNGRKGHRTCDDVGMFPRNLPVRPKVLPLVTPVTDVSKAPAEWFPYLQPYLTGM